MNLERIKELLKHGEGIEVEFKLAAAMLPANTFDTICAFLNRRGGHLLLGVNDAGKVEGVQENAIQSMANNIINASGNPQKLNPAFYLSPEIIDFDGKKILYVYVPESSQVHNTAGKIFDRNSDGDFNITARHAMVTELYIRKQQTYTENRIYPLLSLSDLRDDLFIRVKKLARSQRPDHPWLEMDDMEMVKSAGLYQRDYQTGKEGFTLSAVLLLGKDEVIQQILPHYRTDAIYRVNNTDRYDDRDDIRTNLVEAYDRLMAFVAKHLPDKFFQDDRQRINVRDRLFREVVANLLVHREFSNAYPAKLLIEREFVSTENWNKPHGHGLIDPSGFAPFPKNPAIARFFKEIGRVEELGSGVRNIYKFSQLYAPDRTPELIEGDVFRTVIPVESTILTLDFHDAIDISDNINGESGGVNEDTAGVNEESGGVNEEIAGVNPEAAGVIMRIEGVKAGVKELLEKIILLLLQKDGLKISEISIRTGVMARSLERHLKHLREAGLIEFRGSPKSGGYYLTKKAAANLNNKREI